MANQLPFFTATSIFLMFVSCTQAQNRFDVDLNILDPSVTQHHHWIANELLKVQNSNYFEVPCSYCNEIFFDEPPPSNILLMPPPPIHPSFLTNNSAWLSDQGSNEPCIFCDQIEKAQGEFGSTYQAEVRRSIHERAVLILGFLSITSAILCIFIAGLKRYEIMASIARLGISKSSDGKHRHASHKNFERSRNYMAPGQKVDSLDDEISSSEAHSADPYYVQSSRNKNFTSPMIGNHITCKKTAIPSNYWAHPGPLVTCSMRRVPNEYETPSSLNSSTVGVSFSPTGCVDRIQQRILSPYGTHTYDEIRDVPRSDNIGVRINQRGQNSNITYDSVDANPCQFAARNHRSDEGIITPFNGSVQMSDFRSIRSNNAGQYHGVKNFRQTSANQTLNHLGNHGSSSQRQDRPTYEQTRQAAQVVLTSGNQGQVNPKLLNRRDRINNVI